MGQTPLGMAIDAGAAEAFEVLLLECDTGIEAGDTDGALLPLHCAAARGLFGKSL